MPIKLTRHEILARRFPNDTDRFIGKNYLRNLFPKYPPATYHFKLPPSGRFRGVAVALETGEKIKLLPSKLKFDSGTARQCLTLKEMKQELDDAFRESTPPAPLKADAKAMNKIRDYFSNDVHGQVFFARVIQAGNVGLTNVTDPELLPAFRTVVRLRVAEVLMASSAQQRGPIFGSTVS